MTDTLKTKTSTKQAEKETKHKCLQQKQNKKKGQERSLRQKKKKDKSTQMRQFNEKWLPLSGKQTIETKWPDGKDSENWNQMARWKG